jgi:hypothetical protein
MRTKPVLLLGPLLWLLTAGQPAQAIITGNQLLPVCTKYLELKDRGQLAAIQDALSCGYWLDGFLGGRRHVITKMSMKGKGAQVLLETEEQARLSRERTRARIGGFCEPETATNEQLIRILRNYLQQNAQSLHLPAYYLASRAFAAAFPCPPPEPEPQPVFGRPSAYGDSPFPEQPEPAAYGDPPFPARPEQAAPRGYESPSQPEQPHDRPPPAALAPAAVDPDQQQPEPAAVEQADRQEVIQLF